MLFSWERAGGGQIEKWTGGNDQNFQVKEVAAEVQRLMPRAKITFTGEVGADPRNYRVKFDLLKRLLPEFKLEYTLRSGMEELHRKLISHKFSRKDFEGDQVVRLRTLKKRLQVLSTVSEPRA